MAKPQILVVYTYDSISDFVARGGIGEWVLSRRHVLDRCKWVMAVSLTTGRIFMTARITGIRRSTSDDRRWIVEFGQYDDTNYGKFKEFVRNPVTYVNEEDWQHVIKPVTAELARDMVEDESGKSMTDIVSPSFTESMSLTIEQAKAGLAVKFGVPVSAITINISA